MLYLTIYLIIILFATLEILNFDSSRARVFPLIILFIFLFIAGFRYETGVDWRVYTSMFETTPPIDEIFSPMGSMLIFSSPDYLYCILISTVKYFGGGIQTVFFLISLITYIFLYKSVTFYSNGKVVSLLIYFSLLFFVLDMSGLRQGLAFSIFFYATRYIYSRSFLKYLLLILFAASFHWSAYLLIIVYFVTRSSFSSKALVTFFCISLGIFVAKISWLNFIVERLSNLMGDNFVLTYKLLAYTQEGASLGRALNLNTITNILLYVVTFFLVIYYRSALEKNNKYFNVFFNIYICQVFTFFCMFEFLEMSERLRLYFMVSNIIIMPNLIFVFNVMAERALIFMYVLFFTFFSCRPYILNAETTISYHPYQNYLIYEVFNIQSTGEERLNKQAELNE